MCISLEAGIDLITEGITTVDTVVFVFVFVIAGIDLITEGITTILYNFVYAPSLSLLELT